MHDLTVEFATRRGIVRAVEQVNLTVAKGETVGIVGESGSGKSVTSYAVMQILDRAGRIADGAITFSGVDVRHASESAMRDLRGREMSMIFQNPRAALNPIRKVGHQIEDVLLQHVQAAPNDAREKAIAMLDQVRIARPEERYHAYPFELSGGMCQRVVIALALACRPQLLIADEPTTGLDVTTQKAVMELVVELTRARGMSTILITHDLGLAAAFNTPLLVVDSLIKEYPRNAMSRTLANLFRRRVKAEDAAFRAVDGISFDLKRRESVGLVGESGCGKSTTSMMVMRLLDTTGGTITFDGQDIGAVPAKNFARSPLRGRIQMVFQNPTDSLNPRFTAARAIADPILRLGKARGARAVRARCEELARQVGLPVELLDRFPHQLSGGQKARVGIARAIALGPELLILDEPTAALDVSVQAIVLNLLQDLKTALGMSYLFVSHDLNVVRLLCDRVIVMRAGKIVEQGSTTQVLNAPQSDYTRELLTAIPHPPI